MNPYSKALVRHIEKAGKIPKWKGRRFSLPPAAGRSMIPLAFLCYPMQPCNALPVMTVWGALMLLLRIGDMQQMLTGKSGLEPFYFMPVTKQFVFAFAGNAILKRSLWAILDAAALLSHGIAPADPWPGILRMLFAAPLFGGAILGTSCLLYAVFPRLQIAFAWILVMAAGFLTILEEKLWHGHALIETAAAALAMVTPPGWVAKGAWGDGSFWNTWVPLAAAVPVCLACPLIRQKLVRRFEFWSPDEPPNLIPWDAPEDEFEPGPQPPGSGQVAEWVASGEFLKTAEPGGWMERFISGWLTVRENDLLWLLLCPRPGWSRRYIRTAPVLLLLPPAMWLLRFWSETAPWWLFAFTTVYALIAMTPFFGGIDSPLNMKVPLGNGQTSPFSVLPVGIREIRTVVWKVNALRRLFVLPWYFWFAAIAAFELQFTISDAFRWALIFWLLSVALQPVWFVFQVSHISTDNRPSLRSFFFILYFLLIGATALAALFSPFVPSWIPGTGLCAVIAVEAFFFEILYLRWYERKSFDLIVPDR